MKTLAVLIFSLLIAKGSCQSCDQQELKTAVVEYVANSRGFYQKIKLENKTVSVTNDRSGKEKVKNLSITDEDWKEIIDLFNKVKLEQLSELKSPTQKRFHDGAAIANLIINYKGKEYVSASFDHGFPPAEIEKIVKKINSFAKQNNEN
ncbi:hypothetical protein [Flavobacterium faecale]|uniref:hypothetical protein n=1 Tax=Flavobacterium faecale TaxID=1355330 RepID=UPI003AADA2C2